MSFCVKVHLQALPLPASAMTSAARRTVKSARTTLVPFISFYEVFLEFSRSQDMRSRPNALCMKVHLQASPLPASAMTSAAHRTIKSTRTHLCLLTLFIEDFSISQGLKTCTAGRMPYA